MSYATLLVYVEADHISKQLVGVAAGLAGRFSARLIGLSALAIPPPFVDVASEADIARMKATLAEVGNGFRAAAAGCDQVEWRSAIDFPTETLISEARCADLVLVEKGKSSADVYQAIDPGAAILAAGRPFLVVPPGKNHWSPIMSSSAGRTRGKRGVPFRTRCHSSMRRNV